jgi:hypothetical protein
MSKRGTTFWLWVLGFWVVAAAVALLIPTFALPSNCGGNSSALNVCRGIGMGFQGVALDRNESPFSVCELTDAERSNFTGLGKPSWLGDAKFLVTTNRVKVEPRAHRQIIAVCDTPYDNVPRRHFGRAPFAHAVAYSDGSAGLIPVAEFRNLDLSRFIDATNIGGTLEPNSAANRSQPARAETNQTSVATGSGR